MVVNLVQTPSDVEPRGDFHDGVLISVSDDNFVMQCPIGNRYSYRVAHDAYVCRDGTICQIGELQVGSKIRVSPKSDDKTVVTKLEALVNQVDFADVH